MKRIISYVCLFIFSISFAYSQHEITGKDVVIKYLGNINQPWRTMVSLENYGINRNLHKWRVFVASYEGYSGVSSNGFEIWEYPDKVNSSSPNGIRFVIETCRDKTTKPVAIGPKGSLNIGFDNEFKATDVNMLSVNGAVGINTLVNNGYHLAVKGKVRANEVVVDSGWLTLFLKMTMSYLHWKK